MTLSFMRNHAVSATEKSESKTEPRVETHRAVTFKGGNLESSQRFSQNYILHRRDREKLGGGYALCQSNKNVRLFDPTSKLLIWLFVSEVLYCLFFFSEDFFFKDAIYFRGMIICPSFFPIYFLNLSWQHNCQSCR